MNRSLRARTNRGFTTVELIVVVTVIGILATIAVGAYNKVVNDAKTAKSLALVNTLSTAKSLFVADPATTETNTQSFNSSTGDTQFALIAQYIRVNGAIPTNEANLLQLSGFPATGVAISAKLKLTPEALAMLTDGVDLRGAKLRPWYERQ
jgi:prepilin-type N-terminal cleavage/methylation domain-containing protein